MIGHPAKIFARALTALLLSWGSLVACHGPEASGPDSETHFLRECTAECGGGLKCLCGVCTKPCTADTTCSAILDHAACADSCGAEGTKTCDVTCAADSDCRALGGDFRCLQEHCRAPASSGTGGNDGGAGVACQASPTPMPVLPPTTQFDPSVVARAAVVIGSCVNGLNDDGIGRNAGHLWSTNLTTAAWESRLMVQADCLANARCGCEGLTRCVGYALSPKGPDCKPGCAGGVFTSCGPPALDPPTGFAESIDCGAVGLDCDDSFACVSAPVVACGPTFAARCNADGAPEYCSGTQVRRIPACATLGLTCQKGECTGSGAACVNTSQSTASTDMQSIDGVACNGGALGGCFNGLAASLDCAALGPGFGCQSAGGRFFCGLASECEPASEFTSSVTYPDTCSGSVLNFCNAGRIEHIDCATLGFKDCKIDASQGYHGCL